MSLPASLEKYLAGEPLSEELAALRAGLQDQGSLVSSLYPEQLRIPAEVSPRAQRLSRADKAALRELRAGEGWEALNRLAEIALRRHVESATLLSQEDPLANTQEVAARWAYVKMLRALWLELGRDVDAAAASVEAEEEA